MTEDERKFIFLFEALNSINKKLDMLSVYVSNQPDNKPVQDVNVVSGIELEFKNDTGNPLPISAASLPLPSGASTEDKQNTGNISLSSIDEKLTNNNQVTQLYGFVDNGNSTSIALGSNQTFTGEWLDVQKFASIQINGITDQACTLFFETSPDQTNIDRITQLSSGLDSNLGVHGLVPTAQYARIRIVNGPIAMGFLRIQFIVHSSSKISIPTSRMTQVLNDYIDVLNVRAVLTGKRSNLSYQNVGLDQYNGLQVKLASPNTVFGAVHTEGYIPIFQSDAVYSVNPIPNNSVVSGTGSITSSDSCFLLQSGTTVLSQAVLQSRRRLKGRPGQGLLVYFEALFSAPVANNFQGVGVGHSEDGIFLGYGHSSDLNDTEFGILYVQRGVRAVYTLTITVGATIAGNVTITLDGVAFTVALSMTTTGTRVAYDISESVFNGWNSYQNGSTVVFVKNAAGTTPSAFSYDAGITGSAASFAQTKAGVSATENFYGQSSWNGDKMLGSGVSGITLDKTKLNSYRIEYAFGTHDIRIYTLQTPSSTNSPDWFLMHSINLSNVISTTSLGNPSMPFTSYVYSAGSTTNISVKIGSYAGFLEGKKILLGPRATYFNSLTNITSTNYTALFSVLNPLYYNGRTNQIVINIVSFTGALKHTSPCVFYIFRNAALAGIPNFQAYSTYTCGMWDTGATTCTITDNIQLVYAIQLGDTGNFSVDAQTGDFNAEDLNIQPGEIFTVAAKSLQQTPSWVTCSLNTREDQ